MDERSQKKASSLSGGEAQRTNEAARRAEFIVKFSPQIEKLIKDKFPDKNYPAVIVPRIAHYLYGAHLVSQIAHGFLFAGDYGTNILRLTQKPQFDGNGNYTGGSLDPEDLNDWPVSWRGTDSIPREIRTMGLKSPEDVPYKSNISGEFAVPIGYFAEVSEPEKGRTRVFKAPSGLFDMSVALMNMTQFDEDVDAGAHEACHSLRSYAKKKKNVHLGEYPDLGDREDIVSRSRIFKKEGGISYLAEIGEEFGNFLLWSQVIRDYLPDMWNKGYQKIFEEVIKWRREKLKRQGKNPDEVLLTLTDLLSVWE